MAGARSLAKLRLIIYLHKELFQWMKCKIRLALVGYPLAGSKLPDSWAEMKNKTEAQPAWLQLAFNWHCFNSGFLFPNIYKLIFSKGYPMPRYLALCLTLAVSYRVYKKMNHLV